MPEPLETSGEEHPDAAVGLQGLLALGLVRLGRAEPFSMWLAGGLGVGIVLGFALRRLPRVSFLDTLQHELSHMVVALLLGAFPRSLSAEHGVGGNVRYELRGPLRGTRAFFIGIAPYWFSPLVLMAVVLSLVLPGRPGPPLGATACLLGISLALPLAQIHLQQPDLKRHGRVPSLVAALWLWGGLFAMTLGLARSGEIDSIWSAYRIAARVLSSLIK